MKKFEPLYPPKGQFTFIEVVDIGGHPYAVYNEKQADMRNNWLTVLHLVPFVASDFTMGLDEPLPDGNGHPDYVKPLRRKT